MLTRWPIRALTFKDQRASSRKMLGVSLFLRDRWPLVHEGGGSRDMEHDCCGYDGDSPLGYDFSETSLLQNMGI